MGIILLKKDELPKWISVKDALPTHLYGQGCFVFYQDLRYKDDTWFVSEAIYFPNLKKLTDDYLRLFDDDEIENVDSGFFSIWYGEDSEIYALSLIENVTHWMPSIYEKEKS